MYFENVSIDHLIIYIEKGRTNPVDVMMCTKKLLLFFISPTTYGGYI